MFTRQQIASCILAAFVLFIPAAVSAQPAPSGSKLIAANDVTWDSPGANENDSMPIGNGTLAANVWTEKNGDIVLLLASSDAFTETGKLVKLGRVRIATTPNLFADPQSFHQALHLEDGSIVIDAGANHIRIWVDANHPALHVELHTAQPTILRASLETWRKDSSMRDDPADTAGMFENGSAQFPVDFKADTIVPDEKNAITWYHFNQSSIYPTVMQQEHLDSLAQKYPDPLLHRCFGARITGPGLHASALQTLTSDPRTDLRVDVIALAEKSVASPDVFLAHLTAAAATANPANLHAAWTVHSMWWHNFWDRSWIAVSGDDNARKVSQGYAMQRYMMAASSRGELPVKYNGGLFTVGHDVTAPTRNPNADHNPDYRAWGNSYWNQNIRLLPTLAAGRHSADFDLLKPWFHLYLAALPFEKDRAQLYYHHAGASYPETMLLWGVPNLNDFGWNNPSNDIDSHWQRYHIQGSLEVLSEMLDQYDVTSDAQFARSSIVPFGDALVTFYDLHWPRDANGKIRMSPTQSLETYQLTAVDPTPDIAGLRSVIPRLLALPPSLTTAAQRAAWSRTLHDLPELPRGTTAANGKTPPNGQGDPNGTKIILPAETYGRTENSENPELYVAFPSPPPLRRRQAGPQARRRYLQRPPLPAEHLLGTGRHAVRHPRPHLRRAKSRHRRVHRLRQPALPVVLEGRPRLHPRPRQRRLRHGHAAGDAHAGRRQTHLPSARLAQRMDR